MEYEGQDHGNEEELDYNLLGPVTKQSLIVDLDWLYINGLVSDEYYTDKLAKLMEKPDEEQVGDNVQREGSA